MRYRLRCAVVLMITKKQKEKDLILLQYRKGTKILNNTWDLSACGHLEKGESIAECIIRETKEEINLDIKKEDLTLINIVHLKVGEVEYLMPVFHTAKYKGTPKIMEEDKCGDLKWFDINDLPDDISPNRRQIVEDYLNKVYYREDGF